MTTPHDAEWLEYDEMDSRIIGNQIPKPTNEELVERVRASIVSMALDPVGMWKWEEEATQTLATLSERLQAAEENDRKALIGLKATREFYEAKLQAAEQRVAELEEALRGLYRDYAEMWEGEWGGGGGVAEFEYELDRRGPTFCPEAHRVRAILKERE